jgi:putative oxidoreductase
MSMAVFMNIVFIVGRILFGGYFIYGAINHFLHIPAMAGYAKSKSVPAASLMIVVSGILLFLGGLSMLLGVKPFIGGILLLIFLIPVTFTMHSYWADKDPQMKMGNQVNFFKNLALMGAVLMIMALPWPEQCLLW